MKNVILYFGSFNPIHNGHIAIAKHIIREKIGDEVWFVVSPQNPLKGHVELTHENNRLEMAHLALDETPEIKVCDIEFSLPRPSYTIDTLRVLAQKYPRVRFSLLMGSDIAADFNQWKEWQRIEEEYYIYVYPRHGHNENRERFHLLKNAPYWDFSSTEIRTLIKKGGNIGDKVNRSVANYIIEHKLWSDFKRYLDSGKQKMAENDFGGALNDFNKAAELDAKGIEAQQYIKIVKEILAFRNTDIYNP